MFTVYLENTVSRETFHYNNCKSPSIFFFLLLIIPVNRHFMVKSQSPVIQNRYQSHWELKPMAAWFLSVDAIIPLIASFRAPSPPYQWF